MQVVTQFVDREGYTWYMLDRPGNHERDHHMVIFRERDPISPNSETPKDEIRHFDMNEEAFDCWHWMMRQRKLTHAMVQSWPYAARYKVLFDVLSTIPSRGNYRRYSKKGRHREGY
jgi:hypothetical protein